MYFLTYNGAERWCFIVALINESLIGLVNYRHYGTIGVVYMGGWKSIEDRRAVLAGSLKLPLQSLSVYQQWAL